VLLKMLVEITVELVAVVTDVCEVRVVLVPVALVLVTVLLVVERVAVVADVCEVREMLVSVTVVKVLVAKLGADVTVELASPAVVLVCVVRPPTSGRLRPTKSLMLPTPLPA
jgi:hypothetical protein